MRTLAAILILSTIPTAGFAEEKPAAPAKVTDRNDPNFVICRRQEVTGSLAGTKKICRTRAEWIEQSRNSEELAQGLQDRGHINSCSIVEDDDDLLQLAAVVEIPTARER